MDRSNAAALVAGTAVTVVVTFLLFLLPAWFPIGEIRSAVFDWTGVWIFGNPFLQLRVAGGLPGGLVTGALARDPDGRPNLGLAMKYGVIAPLLGLGGTFVVAVLIAAALSLPVAGMFVYLPMFVMFFPFYALGGIVASAAGGWIAGTWFRYRRRQTTTVEGD